MVAIPGGTFWMGTDDPEIERLCKKYNWNDFRREKPQHQVTLSSFFMGKYPITQKQWQAIALLDKVNIDLNPNPSHFTGDNRPVEKVNWYEAVEFCQRLSRETGKDYRLPSEAEWEYACRAGTTTPFYFGETITTDLANYRGIDVEYENNEYSVIYALESKGQYRAKTIPVGQFPPNAFGLYDMHGNIWEWCADESHYNYENAPLNNNIWLNGYDDTRLMRGGSWLISPIFCRSAFRIASDKCNYCHDTLGFRVVCVFKRNL